MATNPVMGSVEAFMPILTLINEDPEKVATTAALAGLLPPEDDKTDPGAGFAQALSGVRAPAQPNVQAPAARGPIGAPAIPSTVPQITGLLAPQTPARQSDLGRLILGG